MKHINFRRITLVIGYLYTFRNDHSKYSDSYHLSPYNYKSYILVMRAFKIYSLSFQVWYYLSITIYSRYAVCITSP